ncbi:MAG: SUMF1/EgtB/PvdO family nonheme iron enzyme [Acidobacteriia bacterium]|nr:SUMF1/EgtB/PvdO family nonheme iron enzyme [Terriglobia bacterium]
MSTKPHPFVANRRPAVFSFAGYTLDLIRGSLLRGTEEVKLRPKSYEALKYLVENAGRLVPKTELMTVLWPDTPAVSDDSLTHCVMDVRRVLRDDGQQFIRTVPGRGYLFDAPVEVAREMGPALPVREPNRRVSRIPKGAAIAGLALLGIAGLAWAVRKQADRNWARAAIPRVEELTASGRYPEAYDLALQVLAHLPAEPGVVRLMPELSDELSVSTTPPGAEVLLRRLGSVRTERVGVTPVQHARIARGEYILSIRKAGYADFERTVSSTLERTRPANRTPWGIRLEHQLLEASKVPQGMAPVPGGEYRLRGYSRPGEARARLDDYFIDKFEVSNREFKAFLDAGGYNKSQFWDSPSVAPGLKDKTGLSGPRGWVGGTYSEGKATHPVTGVTWHEAAAFCRFRGKDLPTLFQWEKAALTDMWAPFGVIFPWGLLDPKDVATRANFDTAGTAPVDSFEFGMSPFGVYNMAGNVAEWIRNRYDNGFTTVGGSWSDPVYRFESYGPRPALHSAETLGFRCAVAAVSTTGDQGGIRLTSNEQVFHYPVSNGSEFQAAKARYAYEKTPLNAKVVAVEEAQPWRREEIAFDGYGGERVRAFLYLPKNATPPYQVIHYLSGGAWWFGVPVTEVVESGSARLAPYIRAGRAVFLVVLKGFAGRELVGPYAPWTPRPQDNQKYRLSLASAEHGEELLYGAVDMQRGFDYLETRSDIDTRKVAFWNDSTFEFGVVFAGVDQRYASVILVGSGVIPELYHIPPEMNPLHFAPHVRAPKLMLNGLYDDLHPERTSVEPLFRLLREPKRRANFVGGHMPLPEVAVPILNAWLDETLGPVARR